MAKPGPLRLHLANIYLHRACLFFREKPYPWKSPQADLAAAEKLIHDCGYRRRAPELADDSSAFQRWVWSRMITSPARDGRTFSHAATISFVPDGTRAVSPDDSHR
ncbi:MAG: hypothetical protein HYY24_24465 [Verrucomicrobia bacterium]|nr:hypothetical protein [Verrucomicrobiota bacterium]